MSANYAARIGALFYVLWGLVHILGGTAMLHASQNPPEFISMLSGVQADSANAPADMELISKNVFAFHSFNIAWMGVLAVSIAALLNWKNSGAGFWINLSLVGLADTGLIIFMVIPGVIKISDAWIGPTLFAFALAFSVRGRLTAHKSTV
ncbi:MAG: hypothetical protein JNM27_02810 [Leptospirales bacterium]|nr:hypothetical protein [Leptospirales bacterium]